MQITYILYLLIFIIVSIFFYHLFLFYIKFQFIYDILYAWKQKFKNGGIIFDGIGRYRNDYYLCLDKKNNFSTHIHLITETPKLCYIAKKNNKHSKLYKIDTNKKPDTIVSEMLDVFNKL